MKRLPLATEESLLSVLHRAGREMDVRQARSDLAGIASRMPMLVLLETRRSGRGRRRSAIRILADIAAEIYFAHTGEVPGHAQYNSGRLGGQFPRFVTMLADALCIQFDRAKVPYICKEVREELSRKAKLPVQRDRVSGDESRIIARGRQLVAHVSGWDDDGEPIIDGYQPAPDLDLSVEDIFSGAIRDKS